MSLEYTIMDNSKEVLNALERQVEAGLEGVGIQCEGYAQDVIDAGVPRNSGSWYTSQGGAGLRGSIDHEVVIKEHLYPEKTQLPEETSTPKLSYSYAPAPEAVETTIDYESDTDFGRRIYGRDPAEVWPLVDELVSEALRVINPRLYDGFMRRLQ